MTTELDLNTRAIVSGVVGTYDATESVKRVAVLLRWKRKLPKKNHLTDSHIQSTKSIYYRTIVTWVVVTY